RPPSPIEDSGRALALNATLRHPAAERKRRGPRIVREGSALQHSGPTVQRATHRTIPVMISGINHVTFSVRDLETSLAFYRDLLGCAVVAHWPGGAYLLAGSAWLALIVDPQTRAGALPEYSHIALSVDSADFAALCDRLRAAAVREFRDNRSEGDSLYILDPDGHKLELHVGDLESRLRWARQHPWPGLVIEIPEPESPTVGE
ncbi:MAG: fosfomycin resistance glutathione transferase, partial [Myxococcota bacterium]